MRRAAANFIIGAVLLVALVALGLCAVPVIRTPALLKDEHSITLSLGDALTAGLVRELTGTDLYASGDPAVAPDYARSRPLCTADQIVSQGMPSDRCDFWKIADDRDCGNHFGCAKISLHPSVLADRRLRSIVLRTLQRPCNAIPAGIETLSIPSSLYHTRTVDRRILRCEKPDELRIKVSLSAVASGLISLHF